ncbi:hypothetical protein ACWGKW_32095 [Streptomyces sp. NPDC054766]
MALIDAQDEHSQVYADLWTLFQRVPWPTEPPDAGEMRENAWRQPSRSSSPSRNPEDSADLAWLRVRQRERAALIVARTYWSGRAPGGVLSPGSRLNLTSARRSTPPAGRRRIPMPAARHQVQDPINGGQVAVGGVGRCASSIHADQSTALLGWHRQ